MKLLDKILLKKTYTIFQVVLMLGMLTAIFETESPIGLMIFFFAYMFLFIFSVFLTNE